MDLEFSKHGELVKSGLLQQRQIEEIANTSEKLNEQYQQLTRIDCELQGFQNKIGEIGFEIDSSIQDKNLDLAFYETKLKAALKDQEELRSSIK